MKILKGVVYNNKMNKTLKVYIEKKIKHPKYKKYIKKKTAFFVHDEKNTCLPGDLILFKEIAQISKKKKWDLISILKRNENDSNAN